MNDDAKRAFDEAKKSGLTGKDLKPYRQAMSLASRTKYEEKTQSENPPAKLKVTRPDGTIIASSTIGIGSSVKIDIYCDGSMSFGGISPIILPPYNILVEKI